MNNTEHKGLPQVNLTPKEREEQRRALQLLENKLQQAKNRYHEHLLVMAVDRDEEDVLSMASDENDEGRPLLGKNTGELQRSQNKTERQFTHPGLLSWIPNGCQSLCCCFPTYS